MEMNTPCECCGQPADRIFHVDADGVSRCWNCANQRTTRMAEEQAARVQAANDRDDNPKYDHTLVDNIHRRR